MSHAKEPWAALTTVGYRDGRFEIRGDGQRQVCGGLSSDDARRIVACVNACSGISTENLEDNLPVKELARRYNAAIRERDELLALLEAGVGDLGSGGRVSWRERARAAMAAIKGYSKETL